MGPEVGPLREHRFRLRTIFRCKALLWPHGGIFNGINQHMKQVDPIAQQTHSGSQSTDASDVEHTEAMPMTLTYISLSLLPQSARMHTPTSTEGRRSVGDIQ